MHVPPRTHHISISSVDYTILYYTILIPYAGLLKEFRIPFTDDQHFSPRVARDVPCVQCISQDPSSISKVLSAFHSASEMVSIKSTPSTLERGRDSVIELRTHMIHDGA